jgi:Rps23 Pro-64 3,4-dihydroxylase Tpa1-like proline 4-hydroxylase
MCEQERMKKRLNDLDIKIRQLGYTQEWIESGIINEQQLLDQIDELNKSDDKNAEHYRWNAYIQYLKSKTNLSDQEIRNIINLHDSDECDLSVSRIIELLNSNLLNNEQVNELGQDPIIEEEPIRKIYTRHKIMRELKNSGLSEDLFEKIKQNNDSYIQEEVLKSNSINLAQLEWLELNGVTRKIRNISKMMRKAKE